jgi:hypothetical protein
MDSIENKELKECEYQRIEEYYRKFFLPRYFNGKIKDIDNVKNKKYYTLYFKCEHMEYYLEIRIKGINYEAYFSNIGFWPKIEILNKKNIDELFSELNKEMAKYHLSRIYNK